jgi:hypothetical protein
VDSKNSARRRIKMGAIKEILLQVAGSTAFKNNSDAQSRVKKLLADFSKKDSLTNKEITKAIKDVRIKLGGGVR